MPRSSFQFIFNSLISVGESVDVIYIVSHIDLCSCHSCLFAFLCGITIAGYSLADSRSAGFNHPVVSLNVMSITSLLLVSPIAFRKGFAKTVRENLDHLLYAPIIGLGSLGTYLIIMFAFSLSNHASYIVALRECSVILASILGFVVLKEKPTKQKIIGIILITIGLVLIKLG